MDASKRRSRFEERVRVEREFLLLVNRRFGASAPLAGMTSAAIESWRRRASNSSFGVDVERVTALLLEAAARAELLADNSRDVFEAGRNVAPDGMTILKNVLIEVLSSKNVA